MQNSALVGDVKCQLCTSFECFFFGACCGTMISNAILPPTGGVRSGGNWQVVCLESTGSKPEVLCGLDVVLVN